MGDVVQNNTVDVVQNIYGDVIRNNSGDALVLNNSGDISVLNINGDVVRSITVDAVLYNTGDAVRNNTGDASMQNNTGDVSVLNNNGDAVRNNTIGLSVRNNAGDISVRNNNIQAQQPAAEGNNEILYCPAVCANSVITKHVDNVTRHANAAYQSDDKVNTGIRNFQMNKPHSVIHESSGITGLNFEMPVKQCKNHENSVSISHKRDTDGVVRNKTIVKSNSNDFRNEHCRRYKQYSCLSNRPHRKLSFEEEISLLDLPAARRSNSKKDHNTNSENKGLKETIERTKKYNSIKDTRQDTPWKHNKGNIDDSAHFENNNGVANLKIGSNPSNVESVSPAKLQRVDKKDEAIYLTTAHQTKRNFNHENISKGDRKSDNVTNKEATFINLKDVSCNKMTSSLKGLVLIRKDSSFIEDLVASLRKTLSAQSPVKLTIDLSKQKPKKENVSDLCLTKRCENEPYDKINNGRNDDNLKSSRCETKMNKALKRTVSCPENISGSPVKKHKTTDQVSNSQDNSVTNDKFSGKLCDRRIKIPLITSHHTTNVKRPPNGLSESCSSKKHKTHENESSPEYCESKLDCYSNKHGKIKLKKKRSSIYDDKQYHFRHRGEKGLKKENKVKSGICNETFEKRQSNCGSISQKCKDINTPHQYLTDDKKCKHFCVKEDVAKLISKCCPQRNTLLSEEDCYTDKLVCNQGNHNCVQCITEQAAINSGKKDDTVRHRNSSSKSTLTSKYRETNEVKKRKSSLKGTREVYTAGQVSCISDDNVLLSDNTNSKNNSQNESKPSLMSTKSPQNYINETTKTRCKKVTNAQTCSKGQHNSATENSSNEFISCNNGKILPLKDCSTSVKHTKNATNLFEQNNVSKVKHKVSCDNTKTEIKVSSDHLETCSLKRNDNCQENVGDVNISKNETIIQNELEPSGKLKTDEESVFSQRKQDKYDEYQRTEDISACSKWLKLSDIYNMAPLESSDDEEDEENKQDKIKVDIVYSPLQFDTDSIDELPSLSLPTKRKKKFIRPKTNRCQRVDLNTHLEIQKILRESLPPMSSSCDGGASDDDDARTVTDFSYLSEPRQKIKNKPKSRIRFGRVSLSSSKPQIYSPQEYLSSAVGDNKQIIQSTVKIPKEEKNGFKDVTNNEKSHGSCFSKKRAGTISSTCDTEVIPVFRKRGLSCVKECFAVLDTVYNHELSEPFRHEVKSKDVPDYYKTIKRGMCYDMIAHKLRNGIYQKLDEFTDDMRLIFDNCFQYHTEGSLTYLAGLEMQKFFEKKMQEIFTNIKFT